MRRLRIVSAPDSTPKEARTSTILDRDVLALIKISMDDKAYGQRQRSKWINEALQYLKVELEGCDSAEQVETLSNAATLSENGAHITVVLKPESIAFIESCRGLMSGFNEGFEFNAQSRLIHFAITFRLIREKYL